jgi:acyl carrier protein
VAEVAEVIAEIQRVVKSELGLTGACEPSSELLRDLALDSLSLITLVVGLEDRYRVALTEEDAEGILTVSDLAQLVVRRQRESK